MYATMRWTLVTRLKCYKRSAVLYTLHIRNDVWSCVLSLSIAIGTPSSPWKCITGRVCFYFLFFPLKRARTRENVMIDRWAFYESKSKVLLFMNSCGNLLDCKSYLCTADLPIFHFLWSLLILLEKREGNWRKNWDFCTQMPSSTHFFLPLSAFPCRQNAKKLRFSL